MKTYPEWSMNAVNYDDVLSELTFPLLCQPKLNGVRALWDPLKKKLVSRQGKIWRREILPHIYKALDTQECFLDGELYCHNMSFQDICARVAINASAPHEDAETINFFAFDLLSGDSADKRQDLLASQYPFYVDATRVCSFPEISTNLALSLTYQYEGLMLRDPTQPYIIGRTKALIKLKPWKQESVSIIGWIEGKGKYRGTLGAILCERHSGEEFRVGGGPGLSDNQRREFWSKRDKYYRTNILVRYRDTTNAGLPSQPQIVI